MAFLQRTLLVPEFEFSTVAMQVIYIVKVLKLSHQAKALHLDALYACQTRNASSPETNQSLQTMAWSTNSHQDDNNHMEAPFIRMKVIYQRTFMDINRYHG